MTVSQTTAAAVELVSRLIELQGQATALDRLVGHLCLIDPLAVHNAAVAELARLDGEGL